MLRANGLAVATALSSSTVLDFLARHLLRYLLLAGLLALLDAGVLRRRAREAGPAATPEERRARARRAVRVRYLVSAIVLSAVWVWRPRVSLWQHVIGILLVVLVIGPILRLLIRRSRSRRPGRHRPLVPIAEIVLARAALVLVAGLVQWSLERVITVQDAAVVTALLIPPAVALGGPVLHVAALRRRAGRSPAP